MHNAKVKLWPKVVVVPPFRENGAERVYTALVKVDLFNLICVLKSCIIGQNGL